MAIKAGELIHVGNEVLIDRLQTAGPGTLNIPTEKIYELGNYESVATTRDTPDLTFPMESLDVSCEVEALLLNRDHEADNDGQVYDLAEARPLDVLGQFKAGRKAPDPFLVVGSAVVPHLTLESASYRFGLRDNASQSFSLRGDAIHYSSGAGFIVEAEGTNAANQVVNFPNAPVVYRGDAVAGDRWALSVTLANEGRRLTLGTDYTETAAGVTILEPVPASETIRIAYQSTAVQASYPQLSHEIASALRPAAIKGKHIEIRVGGYAITDRWSSVQSASIDWRVTLERDEEFGNPNIVAQDFDVPEVSGTVQIRPRNAQELIQRVRQIAGITDQNESVGPSSAVVLPLEILLHSPESGDVLKTFHVPDARFTLPGYSGRVQTRLDVDFPFESDTGVLQVIKGERAAA
jgi:hypothetical protein